MALTKADIQKIQQLIDNSIAKNEGLKFPLTFVDKGGDQMEIEYDEEDKMLCMNIEKVSGNVTFNLAKANEMIKILNAYIQLAETK